jgi:phosphoribosylanthranilate isomerase
MTNIMEKVKVKICGIRSTETALAAVAAGADYLGFNFVSESKRFIDPEDAAFIIEKVSMRAKMVGVFKNAPAVYVNGIAENIGLDYVQLHGDEDQAYIEKLRFPVIKAISVAATSETNATIRFMKKLSVHFYLLDRVKQGAGEMIPAEKARKIGEEFPIFLAGGLTPKNVLNAIQAVNPYAVDVAGGIETDGKEDKRKIREFVKNSKIHPNHPLLKEGAKRVIPFKKGELEGIYKL